MEKGVPIKPPEEREEVMISKEVLRGYVTALRAAGYSNASISKRLKILMSVLKLLDLPLSMLEVLKPYIREADVARKIEQEENTPVIEIEDVREFFRRAEKLYQLGVLSGCKYRKFLAFALLLLSTGRRVSEVVALRVDQIQF